MCVRRASLRRRRACRAGCHSSREASQPASSHASARLARRGGGCVTRGRGVGAVDACGRGASGVHERLAQRRQAPPVEVGEIRHAARSSSSGASGEDAALARPASAGCRTRADGPCATSAPRAASRRRNRRSTTPTSATSPSVEPPHDRRQRSSRHTRDRTAISSTPYRRRPRRTSVTHGRPRPRRRAPPAAARGGARESRDGWRRRPRRSARRRRRRSTRRRPMADTTRFDMRARDRRVAPDLAPERGEIVVDRLGRDSRDASVATAAAIAVPSIRSAVGLGGPQSPAA